METKLKMQRKNQVLLANALLLAALLFNIFIAHSSKLAVYAGVALLLFVNIMFVVEWKRGAAN
jgi:hypothetical protein